MSDPAQAAPAEPETIYESPIRRSVFIHPTLWKKLRRMAFREERSISDVIRELIEASLELREQRRTK